MTPVAWLRRLCVAAADDLLDKYGVEVAVVTLNDIRALQPTKFRGSFTQVFNAWGIGHPTVNNGLLVALVLEKRRLEMVTGDGMRKVLTDDTLKALQQREMVPLFRQGQMAQGLTQGAACRARAAVQGCQLGKAPHNLSRCAC